MKTNPNDPAQPTRVDAESFVKQFSIHEMSPVDHHAVGLTKREHFAAMAMQGWLSGYNNYEPDPEYAAKRAIELADALIEALNK